MTRLLARRFALGAALALGLAQLASPAFAQTVTPLTVKDGTGASQPLCEFKPDGTNLAGCTVRYNWTGSAWVVAPADSSGRQYVDVFSMPAVTLGASTQHIGNTSPQDSLQGDATDPAGHAIYTEPSIGPNRIPAVPVSITSFTATPVVPALASNYAYVTDLDCSNGGANTYLVTLANASLTGLYTLIAPPGGGYTKAFTTAIAGNGQMPISTALTVQATYLGTALSAAISSATYTSPNVTLTLSAATSIGVGSTITVSGTNFTGTDAALANGTFTTLAGTTGSTVVYSPGAGKNITGTANAGTVAYSPPPTNLVCNAQGTYRNQ